MPSPRLSLAFAALLALPGCAGSLAVRDAEAGRIADAGKIVAADLERGTLGRREALAIARAIVRGEIARAQGDEGAVRILEIEGCARHVDGALARRSSRGDPVAASAAMVRLEAGLVAPDDLAPWASRPGAAKEWRAVGARALVLPGAGVLRRILLADPEERVRLAALRAAGDAADPEDTEAVIEAARVDPSPLARTLAVRAAGAIGGERMVLALKDLWPLADETMREAIVAAWATGHSLDEGGRRELAWASGGQTGRPAIAAAEALLHLGGDGANDAAGVIERAVGSGPPRDRIFAIEASGQSLAPLHAAVLKAEADPDEAVAQAALLRRLESLPRDLPREGRSPADAAERATAIAKLLSMATGVTPRALLAKAGLARVDARAVRPLLEADARSAEPRVRAAAGRSLSLLNELPRAAALAADADVQVRTLVACAMLNAEP